MQSSPIANILTYHQRRLRGRTLRKLFQTDPHRGEIYQHKTCGLLLDFSKNLIDNNLLYALINLVNEAELDSARQAIFAGKIVNRTENRAALHGALRYPGPDPFPSEEQDVSQAVHHVLKQMQGLYEELDKGTRRGHSGEPIHNVINIGIGGSDLGPKMVYTALQDQRESRLISHFVSNIDTAELQRTLDGLIPETTLFIIVSKTFTTQETLINARMARAWLVNALGEKSVSKHFIAVSTDQEKVKAFGIDPQNTLDFWDWVGGRYSLWSAVGLSIVLGCGFKVFKRLLAGAHAMDRHFQEAPPEKNLPVLLALIHTWNAFLYKNNTRVVLPYDFALKEFPFYLQQLEMESCGKSVMETGEAVQSATGGIVWGGLGNNGQHSFYQFLHQGTMTVPSDFIVPMRSQRSHSDHDVRILANALGQARALMQGRTEAEALKALRTRGVHDPSEQRRLLPHMLTPGNRPSNILLYEHLTPEILGALIALYEHKVYVQSVLWKINPFDQFGVELGKEFASSLEFSLQSTQAIPEDYDSSTASLIKHAYACLNR